MPTQVQRRQSEPGPASHKSMQQHQALKLALGSILTPKRPPFHHHTSSGTASPAFYGAHSSSGAHTPVGSPPNVSSMPTSGSGSYNTLAHGPNSSEHLHPYHPYGHPVHAAHGHVHGQGHAPLPPSRLGPGRSTPLGSPFESAQTSSHPSPSSNSEAMTNPSDIEPLAMPPPMLGPHDHAHDHHHYQNGTVAPPPTPSTPSSGLHTLSLSPKAGDSSALPSHVASSACPEHGQVEPGGHSSGKVTPRAKFLETLQGKSAWDALIHGSFS
jgi:hypothetical protein